MTAVFFNSDLDDAARRARLYQGDIFLLSPSPAAQELATFAMEFLADVFAPFPAREAQFHMPVEEWVDRFGAAKPRFMHHPRTRDIVKRVIIEAGCDPRETYL